MRTNITIILLVLLSINGYSQAWRYVPGKKVYKDLKKALLVKDEVYNLELYRAELNLKDLKKIGTLQNLQFLQLDNCNLTNLPDEIFKLPNLKTLFLDYNKFTKIPSGIKFSKKHIA